MWGIADASLYTTLYAIIPQPSMFANETVPAFAAFNLYFALATSATFIISIFFTEITFYFQMWLVFTLTLSICSSVILECCFVKFDASRKKKIIEKIEQIAGKEAKLEKQKTKTEAEQFKYDF